MLESIIEVDEKVMERYFEGTPPTDEELSRLIVRAIAEGTLMPIVCCSGKTGVGLSELLDAVAPAVWRPMRIPRTVTKDGERDRRSRPIRTARWWPRSSRPASTRSCRS